MPNTFCKPKKPDSGRRNWVYVVTPIICVLPVAKNLIILMIGKYPAIPQINSDSESPCNRMIQNSNTGGLGHIFNLNLVYGDLSFPLAKFVDTTWDIGFGRGGQAILTWISYKVLKESIVWIMESESVTYEFFVETVISSIGITSLRPLGSFVFSRTNLHHKLLVIWMLIAVTWVVLFPSITGAMTGYINRVNPDTGTMVNISDTGNLLNLRDFLNIDNTVFKYEPGQNRAEQPSSVFGLDESTIITKDGQTSTLWKELYALSGLPQNGPFGPWTVRYDPATNQSTSQSDDDFGAIFQYLHYVDNVTYPWNYTSSIDNVVCLQGLGYQWGFSSVLTSIFLGCNTVWLIGMAITWRSLLSRSEFVKKRRTMGKYRATVDLAEAIREELGSSVCVLSDTALERELKERLSIRYHVYEETDKDHLHIGLSSMSPNGPRVGLEYDTKYV